MIFQSMIEDVAKEHLTKIFKNVPGVRREIVDGHTFKVWAKLCHERCNQLEIEGFMRSRFMLIDFIQKASEAYASKRLEHMGKSKE